jgi:sialidase-1
LFSNPVSKERERMTVHLSYDEGESWPIAKLITPDLSGYSCLTVLQDGSIGCLYERGNINKSYDNISFAAFNLEWLSDGSDRLEKW